MNTLLRKWRSFNSLPWPSRMLVPVVWLMLGIARLTIIALPFTLVRRWLGGHQQIAPWLHCLDAPQEQKAREVGHIVRTTAYYTPWTSNCFPQALVARTLLTLMHQPHTIFFGLRREQNCLLAHAWVMSGRVAVTGGQSFGHYAVVGCFTWPADSPVKRTSP